MYKRLDSIFYTNLDFYEYTLMRYWNDTSIDIHSSFETQWRNIGFDAPSYEDLSRSAYTNVIKSIIDSITSKISNQKVRPYFNSVNGTWRTRNIVKSVQQYFDILFDNLNVNQIVSSAFRAACIMGKSYIFYNEFTQKLQMLPAHCVSTFQSEERYGKVEHALITFLHFPTSQLKDYINFDTSALYVKLQLFYDLSKHSVSIYLNGTKYKEHNYNAKQLPFVTMYFNDPVFGNQTNGLVYELDGIQTQIDFINAQISCAAQTTPINQVFVIEGSNLNPKDLENRGGTVYGIKMPPGTNTPPVVAIQPRMFDPQWQNLLEYYIKQAYEIAGISQLSAMSKKPSGLDSGVALSTMEDIESDRFETQLSSYIKNYVDIANMLIEILPSDEEVLPKSMNVSSVTWKDVKKERDLFKVQYSAASSLSKDPSTKIQQVMQLSQVGLITPDKVSHYLDLPDLEDAYKSASAVQDGVDQCIFRAIELHDYSVPDWVSYQALAQAITIEENKLYAVLSEKKNKETEDAIKSLMLLEENLAEKMEEHGYIENEEIEEPIEAENGLSIAPSAVQAPDVTDELANGQETNSADMEMANASEMANNE